MSVPGDKLQALEEHGVRARLRRVLGAWRSALHGVASVPRWAWLTALVVVGLVVLVAAFDVTTSSPRLCGSCHEMSSRVMSWSTSAHASVRCTDCHQRPRAWWQYPQRLADRAALLDRDIAMHLSGAYADNIDDSVTAQPIADAVCLSCHDPNRKATSGFRILIDHAKHARLNGSCVSCHVRTAHPVSTRGAPLSLMAQCFTCHGTTRVPRASRACRLCHPSDYDLVPASHETTSWEQASHGKVARADLRLCEMCHQQKTCDACHGLQMPHPIGWARSPSGHGASAKRDGVVCERCHGGGRADMCSMCHHGPYEPSKGDWVAQHPQQVAERGAAWCMGCHSPLECVRCHTK